MADAIQRALARRYQRYGGVRYVGGAVGVAIFLGLLTLAVAGVWGGRYLRLSFSQLALATGVAAALLIPTALVFLRRWDDLLTPVMRWSQQRSPERAVEAWEAAVSLPSALCIRMGAVVLGIGPPAVAVVALVTGVSAWTGVGMFGAGLVALFAALVVIAFGGEIVFRPIVDDIVPYLPGGFAPSLQVPRLGTKALVALGPVTLFSSLSVGAYLDLVARGPARLGLAIAIGLAAVAVAALVFSIVTRALLGPVNELVAATRRVSEGDIETPVPVVSGDELGTLASTFNQMLQSLQEHERSLRDAQARIVASTDESRRRVERDLHDGAQQRLVLLRLKLGVLEHDPSRTELIAELRAELDSAMAELRDLAHGIYPPVLESEGIVGALREAAAHAAIPAELATDTGGRYPAEVEAAVYFCCLEALQNAAKHAGDDARAHLRIDQSNGALRFEVSDDGRGFDRRGMPTSSGLQNITDRIGALGGEVMISSTPGEGTTVAGTIPLG